MSLLRVSCISVQQTNYEQMGAPGGETRARTVGILWQNFCCVLEVFYWHRAFGVVGSPAHNIIDIN